MKTLYVAKTKRWGSDLWDYHYFETIKERNAYVKAHDYTDNGGTVKMTEEEYAKHLRFEKICEKTGYGI